MFRKDHFISLGLSGIDFSCQSFTETPYREEYSSQSFIALGNFLPIEMRLAETIEWCLPLADRLSPKTSLRSYDLMPLADEGNQYFYNKFLYDYEIRINNTWLLFDTRNRLLDQDVDPVYSYADLAGGKLLAYFPDETIFDGASQAASMEFFDDFDVPAWDTWVGFFRGQRGEFIISYIPECFIDFVQNGIEVNCTSCIEWLEDTQTNLAKELLDKGIIR